jgi:hypothetical protein
MRKTICSLGLLLVCISILAGCAVFSPGHKETGMEHRAEWMAKGSYGIMTHYFPTPVGKTPEELTADFNRKIDAFDLDYFMKEFGASKADWLIFTIGQNTGYFNSPNAWLDSRAPGFTPKRDLMLEIARAVKSRGKRFIIYISAQAPQKFAPETPDTIVEVQKAFAWNPDNLAPFYDRYLEFVKVYSLKFGKLADGWWFDGCYPQTHKDNSVWPSWIAAARAGNPDAAVAFNDGAFCVGKEKPVSPLQDYHAGEVHLLEGGKIRFDFLGGLDTYVNAEGHLVMPSAKTPPKFYMPTSQYVDGVQWHALVPVDSTFNGAVPDKYCRYSPETLIKFVLDCRKVNGAVTYNLPIDLTNGHIPDETIKKIERMGKAVAR